MFRLLRSVRLFRSVPHHGSVPPSTTARLAPSRFLCEQSKELGKSISEINKERARRYLEQYGSNPDVQAFIDANVDSDIPSLHKRKISAQDKALARIKKHLPVVSGDVPDSLAISNLLELEHGAFDVKIIDVRDKAPFTNELIICSALTSNHVLAIADGLKDDMRKCDIRINGDVVGICGRNSRDWMVVDVGVSVVHVMTEEIRQQYDLEGLWLPEKLPPLDDAFVEENNLNG